MYDMDGLAMYDDGMGAYITPEMLKQHLTAAAAGAGGILVASKVVNYLGDMFVKDQDGASDAQRAKNAKNRTYVKGASSVILGVLAGPRPPVDALIGAHRADRERRAAPREQLAVSTKVANGRGDTVRVAHGVALGGYIGASIEASVEAQRRQTTAPLTAVLLLVETIAAGSDGTPIERNLVRNMLQAPWNGDSLLQKQKQISWLERRPLSIPEGANPERLRVVGWLQDQRGRLLAVAQSACRPNDGGNALP